MSMQKKYPVESKLRRSAVKGELLWQEKDRRQRDALHAHKRHEFVVAIQSAFRTKVACE